MEAQTLKQALKYGVVGVGNTLITASVIWVMMKIFGFPDMVSNITGYVAGVLNSFIWNKQWTFQSSAGWTKSAARFGAVFGICYLLQYGLVIYLNANVTLYDPYYNHLIGMGFYTVINFLMNKFYTFRG